MNFLIRIKEKFLSIILPKIKGSGYYAVRSISDDLKLLINKENPVIIDGGANYGETADEFLSQFKNPTIYCFEANKNLATDLVKHFMDKDNVHVIGNALGNKNSKVNFDISKNLPSSSFLKRSELYREYHGDLTETKETISTDMVTIDSVFKQGELIDLLKLDLEGYELEALKGATNTLPNVKIIMTEVWFAEGYEGAPYFSDIEVFLREKNFMLLNIYNPYTHKDMQLTAADAVFLNKKFFADRKHFG